MPRGTLMVLFWIAAVASVAGQFAVLRDVIAGRAPGRTQTPLARWREIMWVVIPAVGLLVVLAFTWHAMTGGDGAAARSAVIL